MIDAIQTAVSGMMAASRKTEASAANIANASTPFYQPVTAAQTATPTGVRADIVARPTLSTDAYSPDVDLAQESVDMMSAKAAYKASASVIRTANDMQSTLIDAFDRKV